MTKRLRIKDRHDRGANLVEMALVTVLLLLLLAGIADLGRAFYTYIVIANASREGARYASRFPNDANGIRNVVIQELSGTLQSDVREDEIDITSTDFQPGSPIQVTVHYNLMVRSNFAVVPEIATTICSMRIASTRSNKASNRPAHDFACGNRLSYPSEPQESTAFRIESANYGTILRTACLSDRTVSITLTARTTRDLY